MTAAKWDHALRVAALAREIAESHGVDPERAETAALLHDIADQCSNEELLQQAAAYGIEISLTEAQLPALLHGKVAAEILRDRWGVTDPDILDAVRFHLSGGPTMGTLAKVIFVADKLEMGKAAGDPDLDSIRAVAKTDLDQAILRLQAWRIRKLAHAGDPIHEDRADVLDELMSAYFCG
jgi:predicted HD superfamily hydrolase involved in NAD metabolism